MYLALYTHKQPKVAWTTDLNPNIEYISGTISNAITSKTIVIPKWNQGLSSIPIPTSKEHIHSPKEKKEATNML